MAAPRLALAALLAVFAGALGPAARAADADTEILERAVESYTRAIESGGAAAEIYNRRGSALFMLGRIEESIRDFDAAVALEPDSDPHHWQRGIAYYYAGRFSDGRKQFERHQTVNPNDVENAAWHFLCTARELGVEEARNRLLPVGADPRVPMADIYNLLRGTASAADVLAAAGQGAPREQPAQLFYAHLYLGLYYEALGDAEQAARHIRAAAFDYRVPHYMWRVARVHAARLDRAAAGHR